MEERCARVLSYVHFQASGVDQPVLFHWIDHPLAA